MYSVGSIIIIRNIRFKNGDKKFDHSYKFGRPCLVVSILDDNVYFVPLSSNMNKIFETEIGVKRKYCKKESKINVSSIYCRECYYYEEKCKLDSNDLLIALEYLFDFQTKYLCDDLFLKIKDDIQNTINILSKNINYEKKLIYKL